MHFNGGGVVVLESTCTTLKALYTRLKIFFKADLSTNTTHLHDGVTLILVFFFNLVIPGRSAVICTRKRNPEDSGRSSKMAS